jgi:hypothetical protein
MTILHKALRWTIAVLALGALAYAADIDGKWAGEVAGRGGPQTQTLTLKADGGNLTGTVEGGRGGPVNISDGKIDGNNVSFNVVREFNGNSVTTGYKGTVSGSDLKLTISGGRGGPMDVTFKKQ